MVVAAEDPNDANGFATGIQQNQGTVSSPSGNTFNASSSFPERNFYNHSPGNVNYRFYNGTNENPIYHTPYPKVNPVVTTHVPTCPSTTVIGYTDFGPHLWGLSAGDINGQFSNNNIAYNDLQARYSSLIDSGSTTDLTAYLLAHNNTGDSALVQLKLQNASPWLSETALETAAITESGISNQVMFETLYANPDGMQNQRLITLLKARETPMPDSLLNLVFEHKDTTVTSRTLLEDSILDAASLRNEAAYEILGRILQNEDSLDYDSLRYWLYNLQLPMADAQVALSFVETGSVDSAANIMARIYSKYQLNADDTSQLNSIDSLLGNYISAYTNPTDSIFPADLSHLDTAAIQQFTTLANNGNEHLQGTGMVRNLLNVLYQGGYYTPPILPVDSDGNQRILRKPAHTDNENEPASAGIKVYPNPASQFVIFVIDRKNAENIDLAIYDLYGRTVVKTPLREDKTEVNTQRWSEGIYVWQANRLGKTIGKGRLVIIK